MSISGLPNKLGRVSDGIKPAHLGQAKNHFDDLQGILDSGRESLGGDSKVGRERSKGKERERGRNKRWGQEKKDPKK